MRTKFFISLIVLLNIFSSNSLSAASTGSDSLKCSSLSSETILKLKTIWSGSDNAASLQFFDFDGHFGEVYAGYHAADGEYRLFQSPSKSHTYGFYSNGYVKEGKWKFYGNFNYHNSLGEKIKWVSVMEPYSGNPYTVGDSIGGDYWKEYFTMEGKISHSLSDRLAWGLDIKYDAGVGTKRKDPRPDNTITNFDIRPGIVLSFDKLKFGGNFRYQGGKEDIAFELVSGKKFDLFYFNGMGVFSSTIERDPRFAISNLYGGSLQVVFDSESIKNYTSASFDKKVTDIKRGKFDPLQIALVDNYSTEINSDFIFGSNNLRINRLGLNYLSTKIYGQEPVVKPELMQVTYQWSTVAKYTLFWNESSQYKLSYSFSKLHDADHMNWGARIEGSVYSDKTKYYFVPEYNQQEFNQFSIDGLFEKGMLFGQWETLFSIGGAYRSSFDNSLEIVSDETLLKTVNTDFVTQDFQYNTAGLWQIGASAKVGKQILINQSPVQLFMDAGYKLTVSDLPGDLKWKMVEFKLGMKF